jgi:hypothetical protein
VKQIEEHRRSSEDQKEADEGARRGSHDAEEPGKEERREAEFEGDEREAWRIFAHVQPLHESGAVAENAHVAVAIRPAERGEESEQQDACGDEEPPYLRGAGSPFEPLPEDESEEHDREPVQRRIRDDDRATGTRDEQKRGKQRRRSGRAPSRGPHDGLAEDDNDDSQAREEHARQAPEGDHEQVTRSDRIEHLE